ncbi:Putative alkyl/aryl-sulfatase YjcS [Pandoraea aquatica]|uniref:Alkyl/aryl-sulfatase YjcS n=1 Tax=Pandoraea aquatica TaxID=2508290 RepID=A0A5E4SD41_9BURK|nr:alkyl sulfatase dimerization domain-containing protein [Pandoraea aquatica]VVD72158.1 Putative alkyl/aryl-sulfatase YjcS [Pandoraea aquatica]
MPHTHRRFSIIAIAAAAIFLQSTVALSETLGPLNSPVRSQNPANFNSKAVLDHLSPIIWQGDNLAYTKGASTIHPAQTAYAQMMNKKIQEVVPGKIYLASGFQLASTMIAVGDNGLIVIDPGSDDDSARASRAAFVEAVPGAAKLPVVAVIYTHRHPDHAFGSAGWGVTQADVDSGKVKIIASVNFVKDLVNDVGVVGNILTQRTAYAAGYVPPGPDGPVHFGIGPAFGAGPISFFLPTVKVAEDKPLKTTIAGVEMEVFPAYGDAGMDEVDVYFPQFRHLHGSETIQGETFPNLYTLRGTSYRDVQLWMEGVARALQYARKSDTYSGSHMRAWRGNQFIVDRIQNYRDAIQYVHDQSIYLINLGYKRDQLADMVVLPEPYASDPWLQEYYGTVAHSVRNIYDGYLGWWSGDATELAKPGFIETSRQYVRAMGGRKGVLAEGKKAISERNYGWAAEVLTHLTRIDPSDMEARKLKAQALRQWAYAQTNIYWRAFAITGSKELDGSLDRSKPWNFADPAIVKVLPTNQFLETLSVRLNAKRAAGKKMNVGFEVTDTGEKSGFSVRNQIAAFSGEPLPDAQATISGPKAAILQTIGTGKLADGVAVKGDRGTAETFLSLFDVITPNDVNLLLPPGVPLKNQ